MIGDMNSHFACLTGRSKASSCPGYVCKDDRITPGRIQRQRPKGLSVDLQFYRGGSTIARNQMEDSGIAWPACYTKIRQGHIDRSIQVPIAMIGRVIASIGSRYIIKLKVVRCVLDPTP